MATPLRMLHTVCRGKYYHRGTDTTTAGQIARTEVPDLLVNWTVPWPGYQPVEFTAPTVLASDLADRELGQEGVSPAWNMVDGEINRISHEGKYMLGEDGRPLNIMGRTGVVGRGVLRRWGPNHAADAVVTRWKRGTEGELVKDETSGKNVLEFVCIERKDRGVWAIPGGNVEPGEAVLNTVKREFMEEAFDSKVTAKDNIDKLREMIDNFFAMGQEVYRGYVDDPRNTDNAWMETVAFHFHDNSGFSVENFPLHAGDDAAKVCWMELSSKLSLYASHKDIVMRVVDKLGAHW